jgi:predicted transposase/invertase (TIGR01784 family)
MRELEELWPELTFENDFVFGAVLRSDLDLCRRVLEAVLDMPIDHVDLVQTQKAVDVSTRAKSIRLDVYVADGSGMVYDIEMQCLNDRALSRRARYYQSLLDAEQLDKGAGYDELPDTFVIFFCTFDPFKRGYRRYTFKQACAEDPSIRASDGAMRVFVSSVGKRGEASEELESLLDYLNAGYHGQEGLVADIEAGVHRVLSSDEMRRQFVMLEMKIRDERRAALQQGLEEGRAEGRADTLTAIARLQNELVRQGRQDELIAALGDQTQLMRLLDEFGLGFGEVIPS